MRGEPGWSLSAGVPVWATTLSWAPMPVRLDLAPTVRILIQLRWRVESRRSIDAIDNGVEIAVVVVVANGKPARRNIGLNAGTAAKTHVLKLAVAQVAVKIFALRVGCVDRGMVDLGVDVAVGDQDVEPAVIVDVQKADAPAKQARVDAQTGLIGAVVEGTVAQVHVERIRVSGEVGLDDVEQTVAVVVAHRDTHAGLGFAVGRIGHSGFDGLIFEGAVFLIDVVGGGS